MWSFAAQLVLVTGALSAHTQHLHRVALRKGSEDAEGSHCGLFSEWERADGAGNHSSCMRRVTSEPWCKLLLAEHVFLFLLLP